MTSDLPTHLMPFRPPTAAEAVAIDAEPIQFINAIQPHGCIVVVDAAAQICQVSANIAEFWGRSPDQVLGHPLLELVGADNMAKLTPLLTRDCLTPSPQLVALTLPPPSPLAVSYIHSYPAGDRVLEFWPDPSGQPLSSLDTYQSLQACVQRLQAAPTLDRLCDQVAQEIQQWLDCDRVMVYRFDEHWNGAVIAERTQPALPSYRGLHFPAMDIPPLARQLFQQTQLRVIAAIPYAGVPLVPAQHPRTHTPLDLSPLRLRGVNGCHQQYLQNMDTASSLTLALTKHNHLWGLIACHHRHPRVLSETTLSGCQLLAQIISLELNLKSDGEDAEYIQQINQIQHQLAIAIAASPDVIDTLQQQGDQVLGLVRASGAVLSIDGKQTHIGHTPKPDEVQFLTDWLAPILQDGLFYSEQLTTVYPPAAQFSISTSGLLAIAISRFFPHYILWFRPEIRTTVNWAGNPDRRRLFTGLNPQFSFTQWQEQVEGKSHRWQACEINAAAELKTNILHQQLKQSHEETEVLIKEVHHRVKNNLQIVDSLLRQQARRAEDDSALQALKDCHNRVLSMALVHEHLYESPNLSRLNAATYIHRLVADLRDSYGFHHEDQRLQVKIRPLTIEIDKAIPVGLIISELVSNAMKYAFPNQQRGTLSVEFQETPDDHFQLIISDDGVGISTKIDFDKTRSLGLKLVRGLTRQLRGHITVTRQPGTRFVITFPMV